MSFALIGRKAALAASFALLWSATAVADTVPPPVEGDPVNGGRLFRLHCAACHGIGGEADGVLAPSLARAPTHLRDGGFVWANTTNELLARMRGEHLSPAAPVHGKGLTELELRDLVEWIREPVPTLGTFFPAATEYVARAQPLDADGTARVKATIKRAPTPEESTLMIFAMMKGEPDESGRIPLPGIEGAVKIADNPQSLYVAKPRRRMGFVGFVPLHLKQGTFMLGLALDRMMRISALATVPTSDAKSEALRKRLNSTIESFVGAGGREGKKTIVPQKRGVASPPDLQKEIEKAYMLVLEAGAMYQKEERDRFWADPDAFKFPSAADMEEVKFDFKESKKR